MAATEILFLGVSHLQRWELSSAAGLGTHCLHPNRRFRRRLSARAEKTRGVDNDGTLRNSSSNYFLLGRNNVFLILKAVQNGSIGGAQSIIQQMYNLKDIPIPLLDVSYSVVNEIKKRIAFPWQEEDGNDSAYLNEQQEIGTIAPLDSTQRESPRLSSDQAARCLWPRRNDSSPLRERLLVELGRVQGLSNLNSQVHRDIAVRLHANLTEGNGLYSVRDIPYARCSWPRKESRTARDVANSCSFATFSGAAAFPTTSVAHDTTPHQKTSQQTDKPETSGPRCAWPKVSPAEAMDRNLKSETGIILSSASLVSNFASPDGKEIGKSIGTMYRTSVVSQTENNHSGINTAPRCAWPRVASKTHSQLRFSDSTSQSGAKEGGDGAGSIVMAVSGISTANSHTALQQKTGDQMDVGPRCVWPKYRVAGKASERNYRQNPERSNFPSDLPRRMLATSVGISLMNYLLVSQGTSALANPLDFLHGIDPSLSKKPDLVSK